MDQLTCVASSSVNHFHSKMFKGQCYHFPCSQEATDIFSCVGFITSSLLINCDGHFMSGMLMAFEPEGF